MRLLPILVLSVLFSGCATPDSHTSTPLYTYNKDIEYGIEERPYGFGITVSHSRYQSNPENDAVATVCKSALTSIAREVAEKKGRQIEPIDEQGISISMDRNGFSGITSCQAFAEAWWE